jgi:hypothetical protein
LRLGQKILGVAVLIFDIDFRYHISRWLGLRVQDAGSANAQNKAADYSCRNFVVGFHCHFLPRCVRGRRGARCPVEISSAIRAKNPTRSFKQV